MPPTCRIHVVPRLRTIGGRLLLANWLAITIGRDIWCWRALDPSELAHELEHVRQWDRHGLTYIAMYAWSSVAAVLAGRHWYMDNDFEVAARRAAARVAAARNASSRGSALGAQPKVGNQARSRGKRIASSSAALSARQTSG